MSNPFILATDIDCDVYALYDKDRKGDIIPTAAFLLTQSTAEFYNEEGEVTETFKLELSLSLITVFPTIG